jgi:zinc transport system ATP-binding protein
VALAHRRHTRARGIELTDSLVRCIALEVGYSRPFLPPIDLSIGRAEFWAVVGRNGSGKTTWFRTVLGLHPAIGGTAEIGPGVRASYVPQRSDYDRLWPVTARQVVEMGTERGRSVFGRFTARAIVDEALEAVDADPLAHLPFRALSEGQKQRVLLARVVASRADVAFLDEPTAAMDSVAEREAFALLDVVRERFGTTVVVVSHYLGAAKDLADHVLFVDRETGAAVVGTSAEVLAHPTFLARYDGLHA